MRKLACYVLQNARTKGFMAVCKDKDEVGFLFASNLTDAWVIQGRKLAQSYQRVLRVISGDAIDIIRTDK